MSSDQWIAQTGAELLAQVASVRPVFVVEIDIADDQVRDLYYHVARSGTLWTPEARMCLVMAAVQAAFRADQDEESFRKLFFDRLGRQFDQHQWENSYGPSIRYCLEQHFSVELPESGRPHCYVGAVYRHAGIPVPARSSFSNLLAGLLRQGLVFTRDQYDESLPRITSTVARRFLESEAGYDFTQRTAQLILRIGDGRISVHELESFPSYQRGLFSDVVRRITDLGGPPRTFGRVRGDAFPLPRLVLDKDARQLVLQFDPKGVAAGAYRIGAQPVLYSKIRCPGAGRPQGYMKPGWRPWKVEKWWRPGQSPAALFRTSDGAFVADSGEVSCGCYSLVTSIPDQVPPSIIREEGAYLDQDQSEDYYTIVEIDVSPGDDLSDLGFSVGESRALPSLRFCVNGRGHPLGSNTFSSSLPEIEILNWNPDFSRDYWIWADDGSGERRVDVTPGNSRFGVSTGCPAQGTIWLERKINTRVTDRLAYSVVPQELAVSFIEACGAVDAPVHIQTRLPAGWLINWRTPVTSCGPELWRVPADESLVEGVITYQAFRLLLSLRVPRASLRFSPDRAILWMEHLREPVGVVVQGLPNTRCSIAIEAEGSRLPIWQLGILPPSGGKQLTSSRFRDALETCGLPAAEFAVELVGHSCFHTNRYFASGKAIEDGLAELRSESAAFKLPGLGKTLEEAARLMHFRQRTLALPAALDATPLRGFLCGLAYGAVKLDGTCIEREPEQLAAFAPEPVKRVVAWVESARDTSLAVLSDVIAAYPAETVRDLPIKRWKELAEALRQQVEDDLNLPELIGEWRQAVVDNRYGRAESKFSRRPGGAELTDVVKRYLIAFSQSENDRLEILATACVSLRHIIDSSESDSLVRLISSGFLQLAYYHSVHREAAANVSPPDFPMGLQRLGASMQALGARCRGQICDATWHTGLGFAEVSPRNEDADLEAALGRHKTTALGDQPDAGGSQTRASL